MRSPLRVLAATCMLAFGAGIIAFAMTSNSAADRDFIAYWAAGQQLTHHANPYDLVEVLRIEHAAGYAGDRPNYVRYPPYALFLALPLGFVSARTGAILWSLVLIAVLMGSVRFLWIMQGRPADRLHLISYVFPPAMACLFAGQVGILLLFGAVLFLYLLPQRPYLAGSALLLCLVKPHLFLPLGVVLLGWMVLRRAHKVAIGLAIAFCAALAAAFILDPHVWPDYAHLAKTAGIENEFIPVLSTVIRMALDRHATWLQFIPALLGCLWALRYFWARRKRWNWMEHGPLLLLVSVMVAPYAWFTDETVLLPAILFGLYRASDAGRSLLPFACIAGVALIEVVAGVPLNSGFYLWTAPAWLLWYLSVPSERIAAPSRPDASTLVRGIAPVKLPDAS
jgi:hypothetical protein